MCDGTAGIPGFEPGKLPDQDRVGLPVPLYPIECGLRTRTSTRFELAVSAGWITPASCAARDLNPDPLIKNQLHNRSCSRRLEPHAGIEPASSAWKAVTLAVVLVRHGGSCGARTRGLLLFGEPLYRLS